MLQTWVTNWAAVLPALGVCAFISTFIIAGLDPAILFGVAEKDARVEPGMMNHGGTGMVKAGENGA